MSEPASDGTNAQVVRIDPVGGFAISCVLAVATFVAAMHAVHKRLASGGGGVAALGARMRIRAAKASLV